MHNIWTIAKKEYKSFFYSPIAFVIGVVIFLILGIFFWYLLNFAIQYQSFIPETSSILDWLIFPLFFLAIPVLTMRTVSDENKSGTLELLLTKPVKDGELIVGKWLGTFLFFMTIIAITWVYPLILNMIVDPGIDQMLLISNYLGLSLLTGTLIAIGILISTIFKNQIATLITTLGVFILLWILSSIGQTGTGFGADLLNYLSITNHYEPFRVGIVELKDIIYYISVTILCLFFSSRVIEARRWK